MLTTALLKGDFVMIFDDVAEMLATAAALAVAPYVASALWDHLRTGRRTSK